MQTSLSSSPEPNFAYCITHKMRYGGEENHELPLSRLSVAISRAQKELRKIMSGPEGLLPLWPFDCSNMQKVLPIVDDMYHRDSGVSFLNLEATRL